MAHSADEKDALIVTDIQRDFCPGGALAVPEGDLIVPAVNRLARRFAHVILTQDWHPPGHISFATGPKRPAAAANSSARGACSSSGWRSNSS